MANPYTERLSSLDSQRVQSNMRQLSNIVGLPLRKPGQITSPSGVPTGKIPQPQEDDSYKQGAFWANFDHHRQNDPHFDQFSNELTKLSTGLRQQVQAGYMPQQIAQDRIHQFVLDTFHSRNTKNPEIEQQQAQADQQQKMQQLLGVMSQQVPQQQQPQQTPAIQNLSNQQGGY